MTEELWFAWEDPLRFLQSLRSCLLTPIAKTWNERRLRLFAVACGRRVHARYGDSKVLALRDARILAAIEAAEMLADARTNVVRTNYRDARRVLWADKEWLETLPGLMSRSITARNALIAAIQASYYAALLAVGVRPEETLQERIAQGPLLRDIMGNPFRPVTFIREWRTSTAVALARGMYESRDFSAMPILADALQDAGCDNADILSHCRDPQRVHVRGCWVVDGVLGKS